jgi:hypothetical protein
VPTRAKPARWIEDLPLEELRPHPENPKRHDLGLLRNSIEHFGFVEPIVLDERTGFVISGHGRLDTMLDRQRVGSKKIPEGVVVRDGRWAVPVVRGWSSKDDGDARAVLVALNQVGPKGGWDADALLDILQAVDSDQLLALTGFSDAEFRKLMMRQGRSDGSLLAQADVTMGEPAYAVSVGDCYRLAGIHLLVVVDVMSGWATWAPLLSGEALFVPYPGPYAAVSDVADRRPLVLVQPEPYIAGHLLDKFAAHAGDDAIERVT